MTFDEARAACLLGLKVRRKAWNAIPYFTIIRASENYRFQYEGAIDNKRQYYNISAKSMEATDWEIYKEDTKP